MEPAIIANMTQGWKMRPASIALGTDQTGMSAALWTHDTDDVMEVSATPDPSRHIVSLPMRSYVGEMFFDGRRAWKQSVRSGTCTIVAAGRKPRAVHSGKWSVLHLYLPAALVDALVLSELSQSTSSVELADPACRYLEAVDRIAREVFTEMRVGQPLSRLRVDTLGQDLAIQVLRSCSNISAGNVSSLDARGTLASWQANRVKDYLLEHLAEDVTLAELAALVGLSSFHLCRAFKQSTGLPPHRWRQARRIERAREMLEDTDLPVTEVAAAVGYDDPSQLAAAFRKTLGVSPTRYRRERRS